MSNDKIGTLSKTEEFYAFLKIHDYISTYEYDHKNENIGAIDAFQTGGKVNCSGYAEMTGFLLEYAGVKSLTLSSGSLGNHAWNEVKIGDEWFESDAGWDEQLGHDYGWFSLSSSKVAAIDEGNKSAAHKFDNSYDWSNGSLYDDTVYVKAARTLGDINGDDTRDATDAKMLWDYIMGNIKLKGDKAIAADINFDGVVDITDGVLLENFVHGTAVDPDNYPTDGLAPGFKVVFVEQCEPEDIDPNEFIYQTTDRDGYIVLPEVMYDIPEGKKFGGWKYSRSGKVAKAGAKVKISEPYTVIQPVWKNEDDPDDDDSKNDDDSKTDTEGKWLLGDVDASGVIDIGDVSMLINHINGVKALDEDALLRADVNKSDSVDISDASAIVNHINGVKAIEGTV